MKKHLLIPLILAAFALSSGGFAAAPPPPKPAKSCTDCGCKGPDDKAKCPKEKGKDCTCPKN